MIVDPVRRSTRTPAAAVVLACALAALSTLTAVAPAAAQERADGSWYPRPGDWSLAVSLGGALTGPADGAITFWRQTTPAMAFGLQFRAATVVDRPPSASVSEQRGISLGIGPALRSYWWSGRSTSPFFLLATQATWSWTRQTDVQSVERERVAVGLQATTGLGVEWFFAERMSLGAAGGITGGYQAAWDPNGERERDGLFLTTGTSRISLQLYF